MNSEQMLIASIARSAVICFVMLCGLSDGAVGLRGLLLFFSFVLQRYKKVLTFEIMS